MGINLLNLFFPQVCLACENLLTDNEVHICTSCRHELPLTNFHFDHSNALHKMLYGRVKLEEATALLYFSKKGMVQQLMHNLKYRGHEVVGELLGKWLGEELRNSQAYRSIDVVIPIPIHKRKRRVRGYNQVDLFGMALAQALGTEYNNQALQKVAATRAQVFKSRLLRSDIRSGSFVVGEDQDLSGKHVLLVDDIITTGATIEAGAQVLQNANIAKLSVATMAITD